MGFVKSFIRRVARKVGMLPAPAPGAVDPSLALPLFPEGGLVGEWAIVRPYRAEDLPGRAALEESDGVRWAQMPAMADRAEAFLAESAAAVGTRRGPYSLAVVQKTDGRYAGEVNVERSGEGSAVYAFAFLPDFRGTPVSREALGLVPDWLMTTELHRLEASHSVENLPAHRALLRMGFPVEGVKRGGFPLRTPDGIQWYDECLHGIVNESA